jgi:aconitate hydratase
VSADTFQARDTLTVDGREYAYWRLHALENVAPGRLEQLPVSLRVLLENLLRHEDGRNVGPEDIRAVLEWDPAAEPDREIAYRPARVILQDFTGVPCVADLAAMREAFATMGGDPSRINPLQPVDLVIDHSVQVDFFGTDDAFRRNVEREYQRNGERYAFLRWGQQAFDRFRVVPPGTGIVHQVNLEHLAPVVMAGKIDGRRAAWPDTLVGTDSHTTMVNGLGVVGWGVGGIEAEAAMLGQPVSMLIPRVVGLRLKGRLPEGSTATDLVLRVTELLRGHGVVGKFVEFHGPGLAELSLADRATPEAIAYLRFTGRDPHSVDLVEAYTRAQGLFHTPDGPEPGYSETLELDLAEVEPALAGPKRPQDRIPLRRAKEAFREALGGILAGMDRGGLAPGAVVRTPETPELELHDGSVVIAAITSCTNTSNPAVMIGAGLVARNARAKGLTRKPWVKTSLAPGSKVVVDYLRATGLLEPLEELGFNLVGFGCTTCIGNSGPLPPAIAETIDRTQLVATSVLSGNRNFEGRISPQVRANYLASPPLVVAYALAGRMDIDLATEPLGQGPDGPVHLEDIWPSQEEIREAMRCGVTSEMFRTRYASVFDGDETWQGLPVPAGSTYAWDEASTYVRRPPFFAGLSPEAEPPDDVGGARVLALLGDTVTTDHISPAGAIAPDSPAGRYLVERGVAPSDFNSYGSRRGNHEVMMRGTFANIRLRNRLCPGSEGGVTRHLPTGEVMAIYDAAQRYRRDGTPLLVLAGTEYGTGSSRDWAAKGTALLGVRAVIAKGFERIHRSNLVGMGVLPLQFQEGEDAATLGLTGEEVFDIEGVSGGLEPGAELTVRATASGSSRSFRVRARVDTTDEVAYVENGGILSYVLRRLLREADADGGTA